VSSDIYWYLLKLIFALPVVLFLAYYIVKFGLSRRFHVTGRGRSMQIIEQLPLGPKSVLSIVQVGKFYYLLAQQENGIVMLEKTDRLPETVITNCHLQESWPNNFKTVLAEKLSAWSGKDLKDEKKREE
jgi:flagellar protein FliO/FliZ